MNIKIKYIKNNMYTFYQSIPSYILYKEFINIQNTPIEDLVSLLKSELKKNKDITWMLNPYMNIKLYEDIYNGLSDKEKYLFNKRIKNIVPERAHLSEECCLRVINYEIYNNFDEEEKEREKVDSYRNVNPNLNMFIEDPEYFFEREILI
jgi:hypothetical protein